MHGAFDVRVRNLAICTILLLSVMAPTPAAAPAGVIIDSLVGDVSVQRAGKNTWVAAKTGVQLFNNDLVRTGPNSSARLAWPGNLTSYLNQNTQVLVNLYESHGPSLFSQHATVFFGAAYFLLKAILPGGVSNTTYDTKIFSPTCVVSIRGTSLAMSVGKGDGATSIAVTNGTIQVRNILRNTGFFVKAGFSTHVKLGDDPVQVAPLASPAIADLKKWVPSSVVDGELISQLTKPETPPTPTPPTLKDAVVVAQLVNKSRYDGAQNVGARASGALVRALSVHAPGAKAQVAAEDSYDLASMGTRLGVRYVVGGEVTNFDVSQHARISPAGDSYTELVEARVSVRIYLVDASTHTILMGSDFSGESIGPNTSQNAPAGIEKLPFDLTNKAFAVSELGKALKSVSDQVATEISRYIASAK